MQIIIECEYCGSIYDFNENRSCPNCAAIPDKKKVTAAKSQAKKQSAELASKDNGDSVKRPSSKLMTIIVKLIPLWIFIILALPLVSTAIEEKINKSIVSELNVVDELTFEEHSMDEEFWYDDKIKLTFDEAYYSDNEIIKTMLPDDKKLLVIHLSGTIDDINDIDDDYFSYMRFSIINPYITNGEYCRKALTYSALEVIPEVYANNIFAFTNFKYNTTRDGYWCFIVDSDDTEVALCLNDISYENYVLDIDVVHKVIIPINE